MLKSYAISKFPHTSRFKWKNPKMFGLNKYTSNSLKGFVLEVDFEYPKKVPELQDDYPLAPDKTKIKREMLLSEYQLKLLIYAIFLLLMLKN